jgi:hypothetical protein
MLFMKKQNTRRLYSFLTIIAFSLGFLLVGGMAKAEAATLDISPSSGTYAVGSIITARVVVRSGGQSINAVSGQIHFSNDTLTLVGVSKGSSIITLWAQDPTYSNSAGTLSFQGVTLNGYTGNSGTVVTLTFRAKASGVGTIDIASSGSSVLLNDGNGTDVLSDTNGASFTLHRAVATPVETPPAEVIPPVVAPPPVVEPVVVTPPPTPSVAPFFTDYQDPLAPGGFVVVKGTATPNTTLNVTLTHASPNGDTTVTQDTIPVVTSGIFIYVSDDKVTEGSTYTLIATGEDGQHTAALVLPVKNSLSYLILALLASIFSIKVSATFVFLLLLLTLYLFYRNRVLKKRLKDGQQAYIESQIVRPPQL